METSWRGLKTETPPVIEGPVFFSHISLTFYESGSTLLSPYSQFMELKPTAVIEDGVFVYDGTFNVPYAAAMDRAVISGTLLEQHQPEQALSEAQAGIALAPDSLQALMALGDAQREMAVCSACLEAALCQSPQRHQAVFMGRGSRRARASSHNPADDMIIAMLLNT